MGAGGGEEGARGGTLEKCWCGRWKECECLNSKHQPIRTLCGIRVIMMDDPRRMGPDDGLKRRVCHVKRCCFHQVLWDMDLTVGTRV